MPHIFNTRRIWIVERHNTSLVLGPGPTGIPEPIETQYLSYRAAYVSAAELESNSLGSAESLLESPSYHLVFRFPSAFGAPIQSALVFTRSGGEPITYQINSRGFHSVQSLVYTAASPVQNNVWETDISQSRHGAFLIGGRGESSLWKVANTEVDVVGRYNFTLNPLVLPNGLPTVDFSKIADATIRSEIEQHWSNVENALIRNQFYPLVTESKHVVECLLYYVLTSTDTAAAGTNRDFATMLGRLATILEDRTNRSRTPFVDLDYHLMHKLRLLHSRTHVGRVVESGRSVRPEFALTVVHDLTEILRSVGMVNAL